MSIMSRIMEEEGFRQFPYQCPAGRLTIGYGRNLEDCGVSQAEAEFLLWNDVKECEADLKVIFNPPPMTMTTNRWEALTDMRFNLGPAGFRKFERMIEAAKEERWGDAARECAASLYGKQNANRAGRNAELLKLG